MSKKIRLSHEALHDFFAGVCTMFSSGYPISDCVSMMAEEENDRHVKALFSSISQELEDGAAFSEALESSGAFPSATTALISVGERVGKLEESIESAADFHRSRYRIQKQIRDAVTYPLILISLMAVIICVLMTKVIPVFDEVYSSLGGSMTGAAGGILSIGQWLSGALPIIVTVIFIILVLAAVIALVPVTRQYAKKTVYTIAGGSGIFLAADRAKFASALAMASASGSTFEEGISFSLHMFDNNKSMRGRIEKCLHMLDEGVLIEDAMLKTKLLPPSSCKLLKIGMKSGSGDVSMTRIAERLNDEAEQKIADAVALIEPTLVIVTSLVTGAILLTVMLPLINIMNVI